MTKRPATTVDIAWDCPIGNILAQWKKHDARLEQYIPEGPGGGNPCCLLSFPSEDELKNFLKVHHDDSNWEAAITYDY